MVYNAMKLFMEVNPQLFDDCSHEYTEAQQHLPEKQQNRQSKWDRIAELAKERQNGRMDTNAALPVTTSSGSKITTPAKPDDVDPLSPDRRLEALRIQDDTVRTGERRTAASSVR